VGKFGKELLRGVVRRKGKLGRKDEGVAKNSFCRGKVGLVMRSGTVGNKEPGKVGNPVRRGTSGIWL
jgi:hypothetical protein